MQQPLCATHQLRLLTAGVLRTPDTSATRGLTADDSDVSPGEERAPTPGVMLGMGRQNAPKTS